MSLKVKYNQSTGKVSYNTSTSKAQVVNKIDCSIAQLPNFDLEISGLDACGCTVWPQADACGFISTANALLVGDWESFVNTTYGMTAIPSNITIPVTSDLSIDLYNVDACEEGEDPTECEGCLCREIAGEDMTLQVFVLSSGGLLINGILNIPNPPPQVGTSQFNFFRMSKSCSTGEITSSNTCPTGSYPWFTGGDFDVIDPDEEE